MSKINSKLFRGDPAAYYTELGAEAERERIIKLLEPYIDCRDELCYPYCSCFRSEFAIALIKGEQK